MSEILFPVLYSVRNFVSCSLNNVTAKIATFTVFNLQILTMNDSYFLKKHAKLCILNTSHRYHETKNTCT